MEAQLAEYRRLKAKNANKKTDSLYIRVKNFLLRENYSDEKLKNDNLKKEGKYSFAKRLNTSEDIRETGEYFSAGNRDSNKIFFLKTALKVIMWFLLWILFILWQFGAVYFCVSLLIIIYTTMRSGSRDKNKLSAYSVFNPNFERLDGTFTAEQFEKELRYGAGSVG